MEKRELQLQLVIVFIITLLSHGVFAMDREEFWSIIKSSDSKLTQRPLQADYLVDAFGELSKSKLIASYGIFESIVDELDCNNAYALGSLIEGRALTDDGFRYFRSWLVTLGKDIVEGVIDDPVSLLTNDEIKSRLLDPEVEFEDFHYFIDDAFTAKYGNSIYDAVEEELPLGKNHHTPMSMASIAIQHAELLNIVLKSSRRRGH